MQALRSKDPGGDSTLVVAGPFEFLPPEGTGPTHTNALAHALGEAHRTLNYDLLVMMPEEARWLDDNGAGPLTHATVDNRVQAVTLQTAGGPVGFILFPKLPRNATKPLDMTIRAIAQQAESMAGRVRLVVGLSPWGELAEDHFLKTAGSVVDVLLGAGPGPGVAGRFTPDGKTFWARTYGRGKALHVLRIAQWPERTAAWKWIKDGNFRLDFTALNQDVASDPAMDALLGGFSLPQ